MTQKKPITDKAILLYYDYEYLFDSLTDEELGETIRLLYKNNKIEEPQLNQSKNRQVNFMYNYIITRIIDYKKTKGFFSEAGKTGGNPILNNNTLKGRDKTGDILKDNIKEKKIKEDNIKEIKENTIFLDLIKNEDKELIREWLNYRKQIKKPYKTEKGFKSFYNKLNELSKDDRTLKKQILEQSINKEWIDIFEIKENNYNFINKKQGEFTRF